MLHSWWSCIVKFYLLKAGWHSTERAKQKKWPTESRLFHGPSKTEARQCAAVRPVQANGPDLIPVKVRRRRFS